MLNVAEYNLDGLVETLATALAIKDTYELCKLPVPESLAEQIDSLEKEIKVRRRDFLAAAIKQTQASLERLKTSEEKKVDLNAELAKLQEQLAASA